MQIIHNRDTRENESLSLFRQSVIESTLKDHVKGQPEPTTEAAHEQGDN